MHVAIYARKSIYSDKSDSIDAQIRMCKDYIDTVSTSKQEPDIITIYQDEGYTGANTNRPEFNKLMKDIDSGIVNTLVCYKIDRISRNVLDFSTTFNTLQERNVEFVSVKEQIDTSTPLGRAMMYICSVFAQMERETIAERIKDGMIELSKSGKWAGGQAPLGYQLNRITINGKKHTSLVKNELEMPLLNLIFDTFLSGCSLSGLETKMKNKSIRSTNGKPLSSTQLYQILKNPHYVSAEPAIYDYFCNKGCIMATERDKYDGKHGIVVYARTSGGKKKKHTVNPPEKWIISVGQHEPLISAEKWLAVQSRFGLNLIDKARKYDIGLLKGIVKCRCGCTMRVKHKVDKIYHSVYDDYFCPNRARKGLDFCDMRFSRVSHIDGLLLGLLNDIKSDKRLLEKYIRNNAVSTPYRSEKDIRSDISSAERKIKKLTYTLLENNTSSAAKYIIIEIEKLDKQITGLNYELREAAFVNAALAKKKHDVDTVYEEISQYIENFDQLNYEDKTAYLREIIKSCVWDGINLHVEF